LGVIGLEKRFGVQRLDAACAKATELGAFSYKSVKSILEKNLENAPVHQKLHCLPSHENVRGGHYYTGETPCAN
jgi:hypothetical protein